MENNALHFAITSTCSRYIIFSIHFIMCYSWNLTQTHSLTSQCYNLGSAPNIGCFFFISVLWKLFSYLFTFMTNTCIVLIFYDLYFLIFRILAIKSGPSSGIKVFLQQSQKDNKNRVILPDVKWQSVGADYQQVDLSKFEGRNFASKLELLLATFSHDSSSSSSWNKLFSSLLLRFLKHVHTAVLVSWRTFSTICLSVCLSGIYFWQCKFSEILNFSEEGLGQGVTLLKISVFLLRKRKEEGVTQLF